VKASYIPETVSYECERAAAAAVASREKDWTWLGWGEAPLLGITAHLCGYRGLVKELKRYKQQQRPQTILSQ
jgi:hypothetical protein